MRDGPISLVTVTPGRLLVKADEQPVGRITIATDGDVARLEWDLEGFWAAARALGLAVRHCFDVLSCTRVEATVPAGDMEAIRIASRCGLRREGVRRLPRTVAGSSRDVVVMARLASDADPRERDGFIATLNAGLPKKRVIAHGILRDEHGRVLLCELTYKSEWDLPGGVVENGESPAQAVVREVWEEIGVDVTDPVFVTVNWLPAWRGWDDACQFLFEIGSLASGAISSLELQPTEIVAVHWCDPATVAARAASATARLLAQVEAERATGANVQSYRES